MKEQVAGDRCQGRAEGRSDKAVGRKSKAIQNFRIAPGPASVVPDNKNVGPSGPAALQMRKAVGGGTKGFET